MTQFGDLGDKAKETLAEHGDQVEEYSDKGIEQGGDRLDEATGGKFSDQIDTGQRMADERIGSDESDAGPSTEDQQNT
jgi:hypothetical protein